MPVIINDFEITVDRPAPPANSGLPPAEAPQQPAMRPEEVARIERHFRERRRRVKAD